MALIFKIVGAGMARGGGGRRVRWAPESISPTAIFIFPAADQAPETAAKWFSGREDLMLVAVEQTVLGAALRWEPSRGGALFPHLYAPLPLARSSGVVLCRSGPTARTFSVARRMIGPARRSRAAPCSRGCRRKQPIARRSRRLNSRPRSRRRWIRSLAVEAFGLAFPNPLGLAAGFDKTPRFPGRCSASVLGLSKWNDYAATATGKPEAAAFSPDAGQALINRIGFNNMAIRPRAATCLAYGRGVRRQFRTEQRCQAIASPITLRA